MTLMPQFREVLAHILDAGVGVEGGELLKADPASCRASISGAPVLAIRSGGAALTDERRAALLAACAAGEMVELELDVLAYEQRAGEMNRNFVRFRDGAMVALGRSGKGMPFLRDHAQGDTLARGGTIIASSTEKRGDGDYAIHMTVRLTAPWAVELACRDLLSTVSIGWNPTGPVECSVHAAPIFTKCSCWRGERCSEKTDEDGNKRTVRDRNGSITVQWVYTSAELVECSVVPVPAVPAAHIEGIRAALAAAAGIQLPRASVAPDGDGIALPETSMKFLSAIVALLSLPATAGEAEVLTAVEAQTRELGIANQELKIANAELGTIRADKKKSDEDKFIVDAIASGRLAAGDDKAWRDLFQLAPDRAKARMAEKPEGGATPVGLPRQASKDIADPTAPKPGGAKDVGQQYVEKNGVDYAESVRLAKAMGATDPVKAIRVHVAGEEA